MKSHRVLCAVISLLLLLGSCIIAQANTPSMPLVLPVQATVSLDSAYLTMETLLHQSDAASIAQDYTDALLSQYNGVLVQLNDGRVNLWDEPDGGNILCQIGNGDIARLLDVKDGWYKVSFYGTVGYFRTQYAIPISYEVTEDTPAAPEVQEEIPAEVSAVPAETTAPEPETVAPTETLSGNATRRDIANTAMTWIGVPYRYGGSGTGGTDCSGFTMTIFSQFGYSLPHGASSQYAMCHSVTTAERDVGDLVFFNWGSGIAHVGIYLGGGTFIHASTSSGVIISSFSESYYANGYVGAGRILPD